MTLESLNYLSSEYYRRSLAGEIGGLTEEQALLFDHLKFDPEGGGKLVTDVDVEIPLSTLRWSDQWSASSGGASLYFQSTDQGIDFTPIMSGVKTQAIPENQDASGLIHPFYRRPSASLTTAQARGAMSTNPLSVAPYSGSTVSPVNAEVVGVRAILGEELFTGDVLTYTLYAGTDNTSSKVFVQRLEVTADRVSGFDFIGWFSRPSVAFAGETVFAEIAVTPVDGSEERILMVRSIATDPDVHWNEVQFRSFEDLALSAEPVIVSADCTASNGDNILVDTTNGPITVTVPEYCNWFSMSDRRGTWTDANNVRVVVGADTGVFGSSASDRKYEFKREGTSFEVRSTTGEHLDTLEVD